MRNEHMFYKVASLCVSLLLFVVGTSAQPVNGTYVWTKDSDYRIVIENNSFLMIKNGENHEMADTLAECSISMIKDYLFEISSNLEAPRKNRRIIFETNESLVNKARINVLLPNCREDFSAKISIGNKVYLFDVSAGNGSIDISCPPTDTVTYYLNKKRTKSRTAVYYHDYQITDLTLIPKQITYSFNRDDLSYSLNIIHVDLGYEYGGFKLKPLDEISYYVPSITQELLVRYCVDRELLRIKDDVIYWKGEEFLKTNRSAH